MYVHKILFINIPIQYAFSLKYIVCVKWALRICRSCAVNISLGVNTELCSYTFVYSFMQVDTGPLNTTPGCEQLWLLEETPFQEWESNPHPYNFKSECSGLYHQEMAAHKP